MRNSVMKKVVALVSLLMVVAIICMAVNVPMVAHAQKAVVQKSTKALVLFCDQNIVDKGGLPTGATLYEGQTILAGGGSYVLQLQYDGNLVLSRAKDCAVQWATGTENSGGLVVYAIMQLDGNFVIYCQGGTGCPAYPQHRSLYSTCTAGRGGANLAVQSDKNIVVYYYGTAVWARTWGYHCH